MNNELESNPNATPEDIVDAPKAIGITAHLRGMANMLREISKKEQDPERKAELFDKSRGRLTLDAREIEAMIDDLEGHELPGISTEVCEHIDGLFFDASNNHLDAISCLMGFMETENPQFIEDALEFLKQGASILEQADGMTREMQSLTEQNYEATLTFEDMDEDFEE